MSQDTLRLRVTLSRAFPNAYEDLAQYQGGERAERLRYLLELGASAAKSRLADLQAPVMQSAQQESARSVGEGDSDIVLNSALLPS